MKAPSFIDRVKVYIKAGDGGDGAATFRREKHVPRGGPDGGDGGRGGHVYLKADANQSSLLDLYYAPHQRGQHGTKGGGQRCHGRNGNDLYIPVPCGTVAREDESDILYGEVLKDGDTLLVGHGGKGGMGNVHFKTSTHQAPRESTPGDPGDELTLRLELKTIADVGLVGYPNAGKSTLIGALTNAHPRVAAYPFTTLYPVVGILEYNDFQTVTIADIPGLIEGAHEGIGLGHEFLRHIERTRMLLFVIDMAGTDGREPHDDYAGLRNELKLYNPDFENRPCMVLANKMDVPVAAENLETFINETGITPLRISAGEKDGIDAIKQELYDRFCRDAEA